MRKTFLLAFILMGISGISAQIILLREFLITFYGNELSIGIVLANWLLLEAVGAFWIGKLVENLKQPINGYVIIQLIFSISLPAAIYLIRILKDIASLTQGEGFAFLPILYYSFFILVPVSISHGALFTFGCKIFSAYNSRPKAAAIGNVYILETIGTIAGGIGLTYFLIPSFHSFQIVLSLSFLNSIVCVFLFGRFWNKKELTFSKILTLISLLLSVFFIHLIIGSYSDKLHLSSIQRQWGNENIVHYQNSIYGNVAVVLREDQYTFFADGVPLITAPVPDLVFVEEFVNLPMLFHSNPKDILILSGGSGGMINEILKHPINRVDYAELDPLIIETVEKFPTDFTLIELKNPKVNIAYTDGRLFVKQTTYKYDIIFVGLTNPSNLQVNRLFTKDFFALSKVKLKNNGFFVIGIPGSLSYLNEELKNLNSCILNTLRSEFCYVKIIPGDQINLFIASDAGNILHIDHTILHQRLVERQIETSLLSAGHIEYKLHQRWLNWYLESIEGSTEKINRDFYPSGLFYSLSYWNEIFSPSLQKTFRQIEKLELWMIFIPLLILTIVIIAAGFKSNTFPRFAVTYCIVSTGFAGMIFDLVLIFSFQILYGYVFYWIGFLVTAFMAGIAIGAQFITSSIERIQKPISLFIKLETAILFFSIILAFIFYFFQIYSNRELLFDPLWIIFSLSVISGFWVGAQFPLANKIHLSPTGTVGKTAGLLYGADLFGGWIGGVIGAVILLPILGILETCIVVIIIKISSLTIVVVGFRK